MSTPVIWLLVAAALALAEIVTESLFLAPLVAGAVVMALGALIGAQFVLVVLVAIVVSAMTLLIVRPLLRRERLDFAVGGTEHDFVIGQHGVVEEHVVNREATGVVEIDGEATLNLVKDYALNLVAIVEAHLQPDPAFFTARLFTRQHGFAKRVLDALQVNFNFVTDAETRFPARDREFLKGDAPLGFGANIDDGEIFFNCDDRALNDCTLYERVG